MLFFIQKEFKQILRNKFLPKLIIMYPIMIILVIPWAMTMEVKNINLAIVDYDKSNTTRELIAKISASRYFNLTLYAKNIKEAQECISYNQCDIIIEFPPFFEKNSLNGEQPSLAIYANAINSIKSKLGAGYLSNIILDFLGNNKSSDFTPISLYSIYEFNPNLDYKSYMIPALMVIVLTLFCGFLPAFNIVGEKESGTIEQINVTPISKFTFICSKIIPYWLIGFVILNLCFLVAYLAYGLAPKGRFIDIYIFSAAYILVVTGIGLVISNYSNTVQQAMFVCFFVILVLLLMSGLFTSIKSMPQWAQILTLFNPQKYFIEALRLIFLKGSGMEFLWKDLLCLLGFAIALNLWAIFSYKKRF